MFIRIFLATCAFICSLSAMEFTVKLRSKSDQILETLSTTIKKANSFIAKLPQTRKDEIWHNLLKKRGMLKLIAFHFLKKGNVQDFLQFSPKNQDLLLQSLAEKSEEYLSVLRMTEENFDSLLASLIEKTTSSLRKAFPYLELLNLPKTKAVLSKIAEQASVPYYHEIKMDLDIKLFNMKSMSPDITKLQEFVTELLSDKELSKYVITNLDLQANLKFIEGFSLVLLYIDKESALTLLIDWHTFLCETFTQDLGLLGTKFEYFSLPCQLVRKIRKNIYDIIAWMTVTSTECPGIQKLPDFVFERSGIRAILKKLKRNSSKLEVHYPKLIKILYNNSENEAEHPDVLQEITRYQGLLSSHALNVVEDQTLCKVLSFLYKDKIEVPINTFLTLSDVDAIAELLIALYNTNATEELNKVFDRLSEFMQHKVFIYLCENKRCPTKLVLLISNKYQKTKLDNLRKLF